MSTRQFIKITSMATLIITLWICLTNNQFLYSQDKPTGVAGKVTDIDGNVYKTVKIGDQWWMAENLKVTHYRDGTSIPNVKSDSMWGNLTTGACCAYHNDEETFIIYGYLYNWYSVNDKRNIAPTGWHVPTDKEWKKLEMYLGMKRSEAYKKGWRGINEGNKIKKAGTTQWDKHVNNESGFSALPGGLRGHQTGYFGGKGSSADFWSSTDYSSSHAWNRCLKVHESGISRYNYDKRLGMSVRLVRD